jgi:hypothetical protein
MERFGAGLRTPREERTLADQTKQRSAAGR